MVADGLLGKIRVVQAEYAQDWLTTKLEDTGQKQADWRTDPARSGPAGCTGDIATHAMNLASFITGLELDSLCGRPTSFLPGRALDDNAHIMLRFAGGAKGMLWASQVAPGNENALRLRIYGEQGRPRVGPGGPELPALHALGQPPQLIRRGGAGADAVAGRVTRIPAGHPEGYLEGFATLYSDAAELISARLEGRDPDPGAMLVPTVRDGVAGVKFIEAVVESSRKNGAWVRASA